MKPRGFTLIELLVAVALISALVVIIIIPGSSLKRSIAEKAGLNHIVSLLRLSRQQAIAESLTIKIYFSAEEIVQKKVLLSGKEVPFKTEMIPKELSLVKDVMVGFNSQGHPVKSRTIVLLNSKGQEKRIAVSVGTGRIRLY